MRTAETIPSVVLLALLVGASGCGGGPPKQSPTPSPRSEPAPAATSAASGAAPSAPSASEQAQTIFATRCTPCHGAEGRGDGVASKGLTPMPRDLSSPEWQQSVSDDHLDKIILYGGMAVGMSPAMPGNPDLSSKPEVVVALREHVRSLGASSGQE